MWALPLVYKTYVGGRGSLSSLSLVSFFANLDGFLPVLVPQFHGCPGQQAHFRHPGSTPRTLLRRREWARELISDRLGFIWMCIGPVTIIYFPSPSFQSGKYTMWLLHQYVSEVNNMSWFCKFAARSIIDETSEFWSNDVLYAVWRKRSGAKHKIKWFPLKVFFSLKLIL